MSARSIRLRLLAFALAAVLLGLFVAGLGLMTLFGRYLERRVGAELDDHLTQLAGNLRTDAKGALYLERQPSDTRFAQVHSGLYWQVTDKEDARYIRSRSLWDSVLDTEGDDAPPGDIRTHFTAGPNGKRVLVKTQVVNLAGKPRPVRLAAGMNVEEIDALKAGFLMDLAPGLALLGLFLLGGLWLQVSAGLKPVAAVTRGIGAIRSGQAEKLDDDNVPDEIAPLVGELNSLLDAQRAAMVKARDRAADMAHGLKTPLAALMTDIRRMRERGVDDIAKDVELVATQMQRAIEREFARSRVRHARAAMKGLDLTKAADAVTGTLARTPKGAAAEFLIRIPESLSVRLDRDDLNDVLGNLLENAVKHAGKTVCLTALREDGAVRVTIEDDGIGPELADVEAMTRRGVRGDEHPGTGLGLAIVQDILEEYGAEPKFARSALGGLAVEFLLPTGH